MKVLFSATILVLMFIGCATTSESARPSEEELIRLVGELEHLQSGPRRNVVLDKLVSYGNSTKSIVRRLARETDNNRTVLDVADIAARMGDTGTAEILTDRLLKQEDKLLPGYVGAAIVTIRGDQAYQELRKMALREDTKVTKRIIKALGYSGYATRSNPVPTLFFLAKELPTDQRKSVYDEMLFVLRQRGRRITEESDQRLFARFFLGWILRGHQFDGGSLTKHIDPCPYPPRSLPLHLPFGVAFEQLSGGLRCYELADGDVAEISRRDLRTMLILNVRFIGDFSAASFSFQEKGSKETRVELLFRKTADTWKYADYTRTSSGIVCPVGENSTMARK